VSESAGSGATVLRPHVGQGNRYLASSTGPLGLRMLRSAWGFETRPIAPSKYSKGIRSHAGFPFTFLAYISEMGLTDLRRGSWIVLSFSTGGTVGRDARTVRPDGSSNGGNPDPVVRSRCQEVSA